MTRIFRSLLSTRSATTARRALPLKATLAPIALTAVALASALAAAPAHADTLVLEGGTVHPVSGPSFVGRVVIEDGLIAAVGADVAAPDGAQTLNVTGLHVYPGFCDAYSRMGLMEISSTNATVDTTELGDFNPHLSAATAVHPASEVIGVTRANGVTHALSVPRSGNDGVIPGQTALVSLDGWTVEEMALGGEGGPEVAMAITWPEIVTRRFDFSTFSIRETPFNEAKEKAEEKQAELEDWLEAARHYAQAHASGNGRARRDLKLEALARVTTGDQPALILANQERDIRAAVEFAEEHGLRMILAGGRDAWKAKDLLAEKGIPVILGLTQSLPAEEDDPYDKPFKNAAELAQAGVKIAFGTGAGGGFGPSGPHSSRLIPYEAAMAVAYGLPEEEALKALSLYPAQMFGMGDQLGSIEPGKHAHLVVTDGNPLEITTQVRHLIIGGKEVSTDNRHRRLYQRHKGRPAN